MLREEAVKTQSGNETCLPGLGAVGGPGHWLLATVGHSSPWFLGEAPPHPTVTLLTGECVMILLRRC